ncbi:hypothetical protein PE067_00985 [Paracoccus sp. DMF-8]|nr:hypothetical protein [Paracoccus sp. DMF-8]MDF3604855.1 hypothetical protein [Paracoccus sp. DMF-8]
MSRLDRQHVFDVIAGAVQFFGVAVDDGDAPALFQKNLGRGQTDAATPR